VAQRSPREIVLLTVYCKRKGVHIPDRRAAWAEGGIVEFFSQLVPELGCSRARSTRSQEIKIPPLHVGLRMPYITAYAMLKDEGVPFVLG
jgi:hypothetical protein